MLNLKHGFRKISELVHIINIKHIWIIPYICIVCYKDILHKQTVFLPNIQ